MGLPGNKTDLTENGEGALSEWVYNDESLYNARFGADLESTLKVFFTYTDEQFKRLKSDLEEEKEEAE